MMDTTTTQELGQTPGRARRAAPVAPASTTDLRIAQSWRKHSIAPAFHGCGTTGVAAFPLNAYVGNTTPAGATGLMSIKPTARHLGSRST